MSNFIQLHLLASYPPSNPNRDDLGRPKTAIMGGATRLRISSQSLKRAWRESEFFKKSMNLKNNIGTKSKKIGEDWIFNVIKEKCFDGTKNEWKGINENQAKEWSRDIINVFADPETESGKELLTKQLCHVLPIEKANIGKLVANIINSDVEKPVFGAAVQEIGQLQRDREKKSFAEDKNKITEKIKKKLTDLLMSSINNAVDTALWGRMLTSNPGYNIDAPCQVAHAITVHKVTVEDDFFTAVDDLNKRGEETGSAHMGETEFSAGLFYLYICIDKDLLEKNLAGDTEKANQALAALVQSAARIAPSGKQNCFANRAIASYLLAEKGTQQPRSLSVAFLKPIYSEDMLEKAIKELESTRDEMDRGYGNCYDGYNVYNAFAKKGKLEEIISFIKE